MLAEQAGLLPGDVIFFIADGESLANKYAGLIRGELGNRLNLCEKNAYRFCYVNDFPMFEMDEETGKIGFTHNPFSMPQGGLDALLNREPLEILATSTTLSATAWSSPPGRCETTIWTSWKRPSRSRVMMRRR